MAAASSSSLSSHHPDSSYSGKWEYDVFLCFRGADTRHGFTSHLRAALSNRQIKAFVDDMLNKTESIDELISVLKRSALSVVIFTENFADSSWCLDEVATISQSMLEFRHRVLPVFYKVDPSDVSEDSGSYAAAIEQNYGASKSPEDRKRWMDALRAVANCAGYTSQAIKIDSELVEAIVNCVQNTLIDMSPRVKSDNLIGIDARISEVEQLLAMNVNDFRIIELWGMGGVGKTTLARACYQRVISSAKGIKHHFVLNINQRGDKENGMEGIITTLYSTLLSESNLSYDDLYVDYRRSRLSRLRCFLVFDDVETLSQLEQLLLGDLLGSTYLFAPGSRIILTTRNRMALGNVGARIYHVDCLSHIESLQLFRIHAFGKRLPPDDLMGLSHLAVSYCNGCPLAIKVFGGALSGRGRNYWISFLGDMRLIPTPGIHDVLKRSYNALGVAERMLFLDIACFFYGVHKSVLVKYSLAYHVLEDLIDKSLCICVAGDFGDTIWVHDLLRELAWSIVNEESKLESRTRFQNFDDVPTLLTKSLSFKGCRATEGIYLDLSKANEIYLGANTFEGMTSLRFIIFCCSINDYGSSKVHIPCDGLDIPKGLRWLCWDEYPSKSLPSTFTPKNLVTLCLRGSSILERCWTIEPELVNLVVLDLRHNINLVAIPNLSGSPLLERLILEGCRRLIELPSHVQYLDKLVELNLRDCSSLRNVPANLNSKFLQCIWLSNCPNVTRCPEFNSKELVVLDLMETSVVALPAAIRYIKQGGNLDLCGRHITCFPAISASLEFLRLWHTTIIDMNCYDVDHHQQGSLPGFVKLELLDNVQLKSLSKNIWSMVSQSLLLVDCPLIETLPGISHPVTGLTELYIKGCQNLKSFPTSINNLKSLQFLSFINTDTESVPSAVGELYMLIRLDLHSNKSLEFVPSNIHKLVYLCVLSFADCPRIKFLPELPPNLSTLDISGCTLLQALPSNIGRLRWKKLYFEDCPQLDTYLSSRTSA